MNSRDIEKDKRFMRIALRLALRGTGRVSPNPLVGCVIVNSGDVKGWGFHSELGGPHAEAVALAKAGGDARGSTLYVNLEPCCHQGRTPPCAPMIVSAGVKRVVAGIPDPDPRVACRGFKLLGDSGIEVVEGILAEECRKMNRAFLSRVERKRPWITLKAAMTLDGNMALISGESKWISNICSRSRGHMLRDNHDAVMLGVGTVVNDDPLLTVRGVSGRDPVIVVIDPHLRTPEESRLDKGRTILCCLKGNSPETKGVFVERGYDIMEAEEDSSGGISLPFVMKAISEKGINSILVEGGPGLLGHLLKGRFFDSVSLFFKPSFGGAGLTAGSGFSIVAMADSIGISIDSVSMVDGDLWVEGTNICSLG